LNILFVVLLSSTFLLCICFVINEIFIQVLKLICIYHILYSFLLKPVPLCIAEMFYLRQQSLHPLYLVSKVVQNIFRNT
jgi:hypothetical protein